MTLHVARDADVSRLWPALAASRIFSAPEDLERFREEGPWRLLVDDTGRAAVVERWREHLGILAVKGVWCAERDLADVLVDIRSVAREQGFEQIMSPLIAEGAVGSYRAAGMSVTESIVALRSDARRIPADPPTLPDGVDTLLGTMEEAGSLEAVDAACFPPFWRYGSNDLGAMFDDGRVVIASMSGQVIGYTWCTMDRGIGTLGRLAVLPEHRRHGVGSWLLGDALAYMARDGAEILSLCTQEDNAASRALYARAGLRELPERLVFLIQEI